MGTGLTVVSVSARPPVPGFGTGQGEERWNDDERLHPKDRDPPRSPVPAMIGR